MKKGMMLAVFVLVAFLFTSNSGEAASVELVYACGWPKSNPQVGILAEKWMAKINEQTEGRVKMRGIYGGALLPAETTLEGLTKRTADAGALVVGYWPGRLKMATALGSTIDLDLGNKLDLKGLVAITEKLYQEFPQFSDEFQQSDITPLVWLPSAAYSVISTKAIEKLDDFKGKKIRTMGVYIPQLYLAAGAVPMTVATSEIFTSLQTGLLDGFQTDAPNMVALKLYEVAKNFITTGPRTGALCGTCAVTLAMNNKSLEQLSERDRGIVRKVSREISMEGAEFMANAWEKAVDELGTKGVKIRHLSQEETKKWASRCPDWYGLVAERLNKEGLPGTKFTERYRELAGNYISGTWKP